MSILQVINKDRTFIPGAGKFRDYPPGIPCNVFSDTMYKIPDFRKGVTGYQRDNNMDPFFTR